LTSYFRIGVELTVGRPRTGKRITLSRPIIPVSAEAPVLEFVRWVVVVFAPDLFFDVDVPLVVPVVDVDSAGGRFDTLSLGPAVTAGWVEDDAAVVSDAGRGDELHPTSTPAAKNNDALMGIFIAGSV
jgi:hypothetical protein